MINYRVKVRGRTFLWGGEGIRNEFESGPLYLHFRVDESGEPLNFWIHKEPNERPDLIGSLKPGECFTISLHDKAGVYAFLDEPLDTYVDCYILCAGA